MIGLHIAEFDSNKDLDGKSLYHRRLERRVVGAPTAITTSCLWMPYCGKFGGDPCKYALILEKTMRHDDSHVKDNESKRKAEHFADNRSHAQPWWINQCICTNAKTEDRPVTKGLAKDSSI